MILLGVRALALALGVRGHLRVISYLVGQYAQTKIVCASLSATSAGRADG